MSDNRNRGPKTDEGRIERNSSRPYENRPGNPVKDQQDRTRGDVNNILNKKK